MDKKHRPIPYPDGSERLRREIADMLRYDGIASYREALAQIAILNKRARNRPLPGEKCGAKTRRGTPCRCKALQNGRCKYHGGLSTGPKTAAGKARSAANLPRRNRFT